MKAVERDPDRRVVGAAHHLPRVAVVADVPAPGEGFETHPKLALVSAFTEFMKIRCRAVDPAQRVWRNVAADHQEVAAQLAHEIELAFGSGERPAALWFRHAFEIAEWLERHDAESERGHHAPDVLRRAVERQQITLEDFDARESRRRNRLELFRQSAAQRNRHDRSVHNVRSS